MELEIEKLEEKKRLQDAFLNQLDHEVKNLRKDKESLEEGVSKAETNNYIRQGLQPIYNMLEDPIKIKNMMDDKWFIQLMDKHKHLAKRLNDLDPYYEIERENIRKMKEVDFETYQDEALANLRRRMATDMDDATQDDYIKKMKKAFDCKKELREKEQSIKFLNDFKDNTMVERDRIEEDLEFNKALKIEKDAKMLKANSNIDVQIRFRRSIVEISMKKAIPELKDAILISRSAIIDLNKEILDKGHKKVKALMDNIEKKNEVERSMYNVKEKELEIQAKIVESAAVTR